MTKPIVIPEWLSKYLLPIALGASTFGITSFFTNIVQQQTQDARITALENTMKGVVAEQKVNSEWRIHGVDFERQEQKDIASILEGQRQIIKALIAIYPNHKAPLIMPDSAIEKK